MVYTVATFAQHYQLVQYMTVASTTLLAYDCLIAFSDEVELVWRSDWKLGKVLFLATRYLGFVDSSLMLVYLLVPKLGNDLCSRIFQASIYLVVIGIIIAGMILSMRTYALWMKSRRVLAVLASLTLVGFVFVVVVYSEARSNLEFWDTSLTTFAHCTTGNKIRTDHIFVVFAMMMSVACVIMILTLWKGVRQWQQDLHHSPLLVIFYRDGMLYFFCLFALSTANFVISLRNIGDGDYSVLLIELQRVFHSVLSARMILNMRRASTMPEVDKHYCDGALPLASVHFASRIADVSELNQRSDSSADIIIEMRGLQTPVSAKDTQAETWTDPNDRSADQSFHGVNSLTHAELDQIRGLRAESPASVQRHLDSGADELPESATYTLSRPLLADRCNSRV